MPHYWHRISQSTVMLFRLNYVKVPKTPEVQTKTKVMCFPAWSISPALFTSLWNSLWWLLGDWHDFQSIWENFLLKPQAEFSWWVLWGGRMVVLFTLLDFSNLFGIKFLMLSTYYFLSYFIVLCPLSKIFNIAWVCLLLNQNANVIIF